MSPAQVQPPLSTWMHTKDVSEEGFRLSLVEAAAEVDTAVPHRQPIAGVLSDLELFRALWPMRAI